MISQRIGDRIARNANRNMNATIEDEASVVYGGREARIDAGKHRRSVITFHDHLMRRSSTVLEGNMDMGSSDSSVVVAFKVLLAGAAMGSKTLQRMGFNLCIAEIR